MQTYYDIDEILAEDELIPCTTNFDFALLGFLDPEYANYSYQEERRKNLKRDRSTPNNVTLPAGHRIKMPLWSIDLWSKLSYVRIGLPKQYGSKMRERLVADPSHVDLRTITRNGNGGERFLLTGTRVVDLVNACHRRVQNETRRATRTSREFKRRQEEAKIMGEVHTDAQYLRAVLLKLYSGERMRRTLDWSLNSGMDDDVSRYTSRLTDTERKLFAVGAGASRAYQDWKASSSGGGTALALRQNLKRMAMLPVITPNSFEASTRAVTPENASVNDGSNVTKRLRAF